MDRTMWDRIGKRVLADVQKAGSKVRMYHIKISLQLLDESIFSISNNNGRKHFLASDRIRQLGLAPPTN